jgi:hypothetical protein
MCPRGRFGKEAGDGRIEGLRTKRIHALFGLRHHAADDVEHFAAKYARYLGVPAVRDGDAWRFRFALGDRLTLISWRDAAAWLPGTLMAPLPCIAGVAFRVPDLAAQRARLAAAGFSVREAGNRLLVPAEEACGVAVLFES